MFGNKNGATLEHLVLNNSKQFFKDYSQFPRPPHPHYFRNPDEKWRVAADIVGNEMVNLKREGEEDIVDDTSTCCWWSPQQDSVAVGFCNETSIHGFKFMGQAKRHITERIFWLIFFLLSLGAAIYLIYGVWNRYQLLPVIVTFQAMEQDINTLPFPAVTLCNMNKFPKPKVVELENIARMPNHSRYHEARIQLGYVKSVCNAQPSFAKSFGYAYTRGAVREGSTRNDSTQDDIIDFILTNTLPCHRLIRHCILGEQKRDCSALFKPVVTDYGKCCVFNMYPLPILVRNPQNKHKPNASIYDNPILGKNGERYWPQSEITEWEKWNYNDGMVVKPGITRPWKQARAGFPYGLSVLVDPNTEDYFCPSADSEGLRFILHSPLELPHLKEFASLAELNKETLIEIHPDVTNADDDIRDIEHGKRKCFFGRESKLDFFGPYTGGNCVDECTAHFLGKTCGCTYFFMPRDFGVKICDNDPDSDDVKCANDALINLQANMTELCGHCESLCEDIAYNYETTIATMQDANGIWGDVNPRLFPNGSPSWADHKMSIIHIFFGSDTTIPKYRRRSYGTTDLIANAGGILGLCLGFSILSGVEVLYFLTLRAFWKYCRRRRVGRQIAVKFVETIKPGERVIHVNPNKIPVYSRVGESGVYAGSWTT